MRKLSSEHIDAYKNGKLNKLFNVIQDDPELSFEIRMNDEAMVYFHKDKILTTHIQKGNEIKVTALDEKYCPKPQDSPVWYFDKEHKDHTLKSTTDMKKYFKQAKRLVHAYKMGQEFEVQQNIALGNHSFKNRYIVVDMEWMYSQGHLKKEERVVAKTRIDLIIIDTKPNDNNKHDIYLAELKVGLESTEGNSGTIDHVRKTNTLISNIPACQDLITDVTNMLAQKIELGLITDQPKDWKFNPDSKPKMMIILAFRGEEEFKILEEDAKTAKEEAKKLGMDEPKILLHNALITLKNI